MNSSAVRWSSTVRGRLSTQPTHRASSTSSSSPTTGCPLPRRQVHAVALRRDPYGYPVVRRGASACGPTSAAWGGGCRTAPQCRQRTTVPAGCSTTRSAQCRRHCRHWWASARRRCCRAVGRLTAWSWEQERPGASRSPRSGPARPAPAPGRRGRAAGRGGCRPRWPGRRTWGAGSGRAGPTADAFRGLQSRRHRSGGRDGSGPRRGGGHHHPCRACSTCQRRGAASACLGSGQLVPGGTRPRRLRNSCQQRSMSSRISSSVSSCALAYSSWTSSPAADDWLGGR